MKALTSIPGVPPLIAFILAQKQLIRGIMLGAVKG